LADRQEGADEVLLRALGARIAGSNSDRTISALAGRQQDLPRTAQSTRPSSTSPTDCYVHPGGRDEPFLDVEPPEHYLYEP
jgi:hypothetical protein